MRRTAALVVAAFLLLAVSACSSDEGTTVSAVSLLSAAPDKVVDTGSSRFRFEATLKAEGQTLHMDGEGEQLFDPPAGRAEMEMSGLPGANGTLEMILRGQTMFMGGGFLDRLLPAGKKWVKLDLAELADEAGTDLGQFSGPQNDPRQTLAFLKGVSDDVEEVGTEEIDGVDTTHYRATMNLEKAAAEAEGIGDPDAIRQAIELFGVDTIPMDVWVDDDGLARRVAMEFSIPKAGGLEMQMDFFDFGTDVDVDAPPASEVIDFEQFLSRAPDTGA